MTAYFSPASQTILHPTEAFHINKTKNTKADQPQIEWFVSKQNRFVAIIFPYMNKVSFFSPKAQQASSRSNTGCHLISEFFSPGVCRWSKGEHGANCHLLLAFSLSTIWTPTRELSGLLMSFTLPKNIWMSLFQLQLLKTILLQTRFH